MLCIIKSAPNIIIKNNKSYIYKYLKSQNMKNQTQEGTPWNKPQTSKSWNHVHIGLGSNK
jgi:hypothetical protein